MNQTEAMEIAENDFVGKHRQDVGSKTTFCAWCSKWLETFPSGLWIYRYDITDKAVSHGICPICKEVVLKDIKKGF